MQIIKGKTKIDFIGKRRPALFISTVINLAIIIGIAVFGLNLGVDFAGGTLVEVKLPPGLDDRGVRLAAQKGGLEDVSVQRIGSVEENSYLLRMGGVTQLTQEGAAAAEAAVRGLGELVRFSADLENGILTFRSKAKLDEARIGEAVEKAGTGVKEVRFLGEAHGGELDYQVISAGMAEKVQDALKAGLEKPEFEVRRVDYVGPQVGKQLRNKGALALIYALLAILLYVAFRFDFKFGPGALVALVHDSIMVMGYYLVAGHLFGREFNLTSIAALLTIIGYSVNDTIVIYDRIREEMVRYKGKPLPEIINIAINDTLGRTLLTSTLTTLSLVGLLIFGVGEIFDFAAAMLVGLLVGVYSTIYIASPMTIWIDEWTAAKARQQDKQGMKAKVA